MKGSVFCAALVAAVAGAAAAGAHPAARPPVTVLTHAHSLSATGKSGLHAGYVDITVRNVSKVAHGTGLIRLDGPAMTAAKALKIVTGDRLPEHLGFTLFGGVPQLSPGGTWHATVSLTPGRYVLFDDGGNGKGLVQQFTVAASTDTTTTAPPAAAGTILMRDYAFGIHVPANWNGRGIIKVPNVGKEIHELTFIKMASRAEAARLSAVLAKGYPTGPPPHGITYAVGGSSSGRTTWVSLHLAPGLYLAVCMFPDRHGKPHTTRGMLATVTVR
jgi:hypothetical protein